MHPTEYPRNADDTFMRYLTTGPHRPNLLVLGQMTNGLLASLQSACTAPLHAIRMPGPLEVPDVTKGTLFVENPAGMTSRQQIAFHDWLDAGHHDVQIISISREPLWPLVQEGRFLEGLFYRLNVVSLGAGEPRHHS
jgi:hypothetical protein